VARLLEVPRQKNAGNRRSPLPRALSPTEPALNLADTDGKLIDLQPQNLTVQLALQQQFAPADLKLT